MAKKKEKKEAEPFDKSKAKAKIRDLKKDRGAALEKSDAKELKRIRRTIRNLKRGIKKHKIEEAKKAPAAAKE